MERIYFSGNYSGFVQVPKGLQKEPHVISHQHAKLTIFMIHDVH